MTIGNLTIYPEESGFVGILGVANGGTGSGLTPANGQLLIGNGTGFTLSTLTPGAGITITNAAGHITISATAGPPFTWHTITAAPTSTPIALLTNNGYIIKGAFSYTFTLPSPARTTTLNTIQIYSDGTDGTTIWTINLISGTQTIRIDNINVANTLSSSSLAQGAIQGVGVTLVAENANRWIATAHMGTINFT